MHKIYLPLFLTLLAFQIQAQQTVGLFLNDSLAYNGYTLVTPNSARSTHLIDNCGRVVNKWASANIPYFSAYLTPEGNLVRTARFGAMGGGIEMFDWTGNVIWSYPFSDSGLRTSPGVYRRTPTCWCRFCEYRLGVACV